MHFARRFFVDSLNCCHNLLRHFYIPFIGFILLSTFVLTDHNSSYSTYCRFEEVHKMPPPSEFQILERQNKHLYKNTHTLRALRLQIRVVALPFVLVGLAFFALDSADLAESLKMFSVSMVRDLVCIWEIKGVICKMLCNVCCIRCALRVHATCRIARYTSQVRH